MKQSLQLRLGQQLTMTPQLQQAIRLLQLSTLDLQQEIQEALDANPLLEEDIDYSDDKQNSENSESNKDESINGDDVEAVPSQSEIESSDALSNENISEDLAMDVSWDDYISAAPVSVSNAPAPDNDTVYQGSTSESLQDYLMWQLRLTPFSDTDEMIATTIVEAVDDSGYLTQSSEEILEAVKSKETKRTYFTAKTATVACTFDEETCVNLIGTEMPGKIMKVEVKPYEYAIPDTGEVIRLTHRNEYVSDEEAVIKEQVAEEAAVL